MQKILLRKSKELGMALLAVVVLVMLGSCGNLEEVANALIPAEEQKPVEKKDFVISGASFYVNPNGKILNENEFNIRKAESQFITNTKKTIETREKIKPYLFDERGEVVAGLKYQGVKDGVHTYNFTNENIDKKFIGKLEEKLNLYEEKENSKEKENKTIGTFKGKSDEEICKMNKMIWSYLYNVCNR